MTLSVDDMRPGDNCPALTTNVSFVIFCGLSPCYDLDFSATLERFEDLQGGVSIEYPDSMGRDAAGTLVNVTLDGSGPVAFIEILSGTWDASPTQWRFTDTRGVTVNTPLTAWPCDV
jgi:hypothetical protein